MQRGDDGLCLVVGGSGFVGRHLVAALLEQGRRVRVFDLAPLEGLPVEMVQGDLRRTDDVRRACAGAGTVFQCASLVDWRPGSERRLHEVNVVGNRHVIEACAAQGGVRLVYTSSIDVVFDGRPIRNGDERQPYAARHLDSYGRTKMLAERETLAANGRNGLLSCALRLAGVYGPGDPHRLPTVVALARRGRMLRLGDGRARFNHVYVENVAHAHLLAADRLAPGSPVAGASYFITDHPARNFFDFTGAFLDALGLAAPRRAIPYRAAYALATAMELWAHATRGRAGRAPLTRYTVASTCVDFYFSSARAERELGYAPPISEREARARTVAWLAA